jgi:hypothetical protein
MRAPDGPGPDERVAASLGTRRWSGPAGAAAIYTVTALLLTWPLATAFTSAIPWDLGDPLLNSWIIAWSADHVSRLLSGDVSAFTDFWHANIFHPAPYALAYSEHLVAQAVQVLPVWVATENPVLCYNLLFLSTFVLSGLGMYLLVRELTGDARVAIVAGLFYACAPYRIGQYSHLQVLSSQWMPLALFAARRYFTTRRARWLTGAAAALGAQNLSCGYFLVFFVPVFAAFVAFQLATNPDARMPRVYGQLALAAAGVAAVTWPFVSPYQALRAFEFPARPLAEVQSFSADVWSYATAHPAQWIWGTVMRAYPRAEGDLFPGIAVVLLAAVALGGVARASWCGTHHLTKRSWQRRLEPVAFVLVIVVASVVLAILVTGGLSVRVFDVRLRASSLVTALLRLAAAVVLLVAVSPRVRTAMRSALASDAAWFGLVLAGAVVLSFGPSVRTGGRTLVETAPYAWLYDAVPGVDGLRVPARFGMLVALCLSALAGLGLHQLARRVRYPRTLVVCAALLALVEGAAAPVPLNAWNTSGDYAVPSAVLYPGGRIPAVYAAIAALPADAVVAELPVGSTNWDVRAVFYSTAHKRRLLNGYSGGFPQRYMALVAVLARVDTQPDATRAYLARAGVTHVIVHRAAYLNGADRAVVQWLLEGGATRMGVFGTDELYAMHR